MFLRSLPPTATVTAAVTNNASFGAISAADLGELQVLGHGNSGTVYKVNHKRTSDTYALKLVHGHSNDPTVRRQLFREMEILRRTDSPNVVRCHAIFEKPSGDIGILMEYMDSGTLETMLKAKAPSPSPILPTSPAKFLTASTTSTPTRSSTATSNPPMFW
ncbi:mitogen-activated protein kinase kinase 9-like [Prunus yedoensis var. nudiflora]|uniref:mitogen-activated protein kinase kinase n=1 Tax=Prunus yedoensis var. nudiflora TaxID=2094558 RepID=A0A314ZP90_PRUYE|nr:mitogen-activated protein kinase kinase 9-like [Prunus yedoensis var. nudiflora]